MKYLLGSLAMSLTDTPTSVIESPLRSTTALPPSSVTNWATSWAVSYTHLTLPTNREV